MNEHEITETLSDIKVMMERSQKVLYIDGASGIIAAIWAILGAIAGSLVLYGSIKPLYGVTNIPMTEITPRVFTIISMILVCVFAGAFLSVYGMSRRRAARNGMLFSLDTGVRRLLRLFFITMLTGGLLCLTPILNGHWELIPGYMLEFYGLALVIVSPVIFERSIIKYLGFAQMAVGLAAICFPLYGLMFWSVGFGLCHLVWGVWFRFCFDSKK